MKNTKARKRKRAAAVACTDLLSEWHARLVALSVTAGMRWIVSADPDDHRQAYEDGLTPAEELSEQVDAAYR